MKKVLISSKVIFLADSLTSVRYTVFFLFLTSRCTTTSLCGSWTWRRSDIRLPSCLGPLDQENRRFLIHSQVWTGLEHRHSWRRKVAWQTYSNEVTKIHPLEQNMNFISWTCFLRVNSGDSSKSRDFRAILQSDGVSMYTRVCAVFVNTILACHKCLTL